MYFNSFSAYTNPSRHGSSPVMLVAAYGKVKNFENYTSLSRWKPNGMPLASNSRWILVGALAKAASKAALLSDEPGMICCGDEHA